MASQLSFPKPRQQRATIPLVGIQQMLERDPMAPADGTRLFSLQSPANNHQRKHANADRR
jgi:hypothetical protein